MIRQVTHRGRITKVTYESPIKETRTDRLTRVSDVNKIK